MAQPNKTLFLEHDTYRRRRTIDAARFLPVFGTVLVFIPLFWGLGDEPTKTSSALIYLFCTWLALVCLAAVVSWRLRISSPKIPADRLEAE